MSGMNDALIEIVQRIVRRESQGDRSTLATVEGLSPLQVVLDRGDGTPLSITPLIGTSDPITVGTRVVVTWAGKRAVITNVITPNIGTDTGWVDLDVPSTVAQRPGENYTPQVRRLGNLVHFRGEWNNTPWPAGGGTVTIGTVPTWAAPTKAFRFVAPINSSGAAQVSVLLGCVHTDRSINIFATGPLPPASHFAPSIPPWTVD